MQVTLRELSPDPISEDEDIPKELHSSRIFAVPAFLVRVLAALQKWSAITFTGFTAMHSITVLVAPAVSTSIAEELLSMTRTVYQGVGLEGPLVFGPLAVHVLSGVALRAVRLYTKRLHSQQLPTRRGGKKRHSDDSLVDERDAATHLDNYGIVGGLSNLIGLGVRRNYLYRKLGLSPLQAAGYLSLPLILIHVIQTRVAPLVVDGDSSLITLDYISYLFHESNHRVGPLLNWIIYPTLILFTTYHFLGGWVKYLNIRSMRKRKFVGVVLFNLVTLLGTYSLYCVTKIDSLLNLPQFALKQFEKYSDFIYFSSPR